MMNKEKFERTESEVIRFETEYVIINSGSGSDINGDDILKPNR